MELVNINPYPITDILSSGNGAKSWITCHQNQ